MTTTMPARGHRTAPSFTPNQPHELCRYFAELNRLFTECNITDATEKKQQACRYLDIDSAELWESLTEYTPAHSFDEFATAVYKLYPGSEDERKWSISDMDKLVGEQLRIGIFDIHELGTYYRAFFAITQFLRSKNRISEAEQSRAFVRGFQPDLWNKISRRLELKFPDQYPDDPYQLSDIHKAARFILHGMTSKPVHLHEAAVSPTSVPVAQSTGIKAEDLNAIFDKFASVMIKAMTTSQQVSQSSRQSPLPSNTSNVSRTCIFCGLPDHFISECLVCEQYITDKKCTKNAEGKIVLTNGQFIPQSIPG